MILWKVTIYFRKIISKVYLEQWSILRIWAIWRKEALLDYVPEVPEI